MIPRCRTVGRFTIAAGLDLSPRRRHTRTRRLSLDKQKRDSSENTTLCHSVIHVDLARHHSKRWRLFGWRYKWLVGPPLLVEGYADPHVLTSLWLHRHSYKLPHFLVPTVFSTVGAPWTHQDHIVVSFDVKSLYLSLPHPLIISGFKKLLYNTQIDTHTADYIVNLTSLCLDMNIFTFNQQHYKQIRGSPMGSPLSSIVAEIVMVINQQQSSNIYVWIRYIDDIFCITKKASVSHILKDLNSFHPDISFTYETETSLVLPFFDILIIHYYLNDPMENRNMDLEIWMEEVESEKRKKQIDEQNDTQDIEKIESNVQTSDVYNLRDRSNISKPHNK
ncbi:hypothetical protein LAZ67_21001853 [Cordylochernes scorpioides]|uniref:Reverse transcriptase domain-containing protein n=1 Tax=Cordylochernes scorpioides TaxID=51811 RepID=A0ABY6LPR9_9ARAC|nr:hypothetical protein LAZ67_21001853 [Cordylochernes scorpioides]